MLLNALMSPFLAMQFFATLRHAQYFTLACTSIIGLNNSIMDKLSNNINTSNDKKKIIIQLLLTLCLVNYLPEICNSSAIPTKICS